MGMAAHTTRSLLRRAPTRAHNPTISPALLPPRIFWGRPRAGNLSPCSGNGVQFEGAFFQDARAFVVVRPSEHSLTLPSSSMLSAMDTHVPSFRHSSCPGNLRSTSKTRAVVGRRAKRDGVFESRMVVGGATVIGNNSSATQVSSAVCSQTTPLFCVGSMVV